jgi:hypothetical protein
MMMEKNIDEDYIKYYNYVKGEMSNLGTSGAKLCLSKIDEEINPDNLDKKAIRRLCELVQFIQISEENDSLALYPAWWKFIRER